MMHPHQSCSRRRLSQSPFIVSCSKPGTQSTGNSTSILWLICAKQLLGATIADTHFPKEDAVLSIRLYNRFKDDKAGLERAKNSRIGKVTPITIVKKNNRYEGVCMAAYYP